MIDFIVTNLLWTQAFYIFAWIVVLGCIGFFFLRPLLYLSLLFLAFSLYFFRNPERACLECDSSALVCPADGTVVDIQHISTVDSPYTQKVSIFLSPFDVHVNWTPMAGIIEEVKHHVGTFCMAFLPKSSELNERNDVTINAGNGKKILVRQIAGTIARRICCWVSKGQQVTRGYKYGMIRFGSRVDILLPSHATVALGVGQYVYGGQTVLAHWQ